MNWLGESHDEVSDPWDTAIQISLTGSHQTRRVGMPQDDPVGPGALVLELLEQGCDVRARHDRLIRLLRVVDELVYVLRQGLHSFGDHDHPACLSLSRSALGARGRGSQCHEAIYAGIREVRGSHPPKS